MNKLTLLLAAGFVSANVWALSPPTTNKSVRCDQADETTYVMQRPYEDYLLVKVSENPSTGYLWNISSPLESTYESDCEGLNPPDGCGGQRTFFISGVEIDAARARLSGKSTFKFVLKGPGSKSATAQTCTIVITDRKE